MSDTDLEQLELSGQLEDLAEADDGVTWVRPDLSLLGNPVVIRAIAGVVAACLVLGWPNRTDRILSRIVGLGLIALSVAAVGGLVRNRNSWLDRARIDRLLAVVAGAVGLGLGVFLFLGDQSEEVLARLIGLAVIGLGAKEGLAAAANDGPERGWLILKTAALMVLGALLLLFPSEIFAGVTFLFALGWAVLGMIAIVLSLDPDREGTADISDANALVWQWLISRPKDADDRQALYDKILYEGPSVRRRIIRFATLMSFASIIASMGVVTDSTAVVIGAMLIAPLMTPLMAMAISLVMGWPTRLTRAAIIAAGGIGLSIGIGLLIGLVVPTVIDTGTNAQIVARSSPTSLDLIIAIAAGAAGAYGLSRPDVSDSLPGVAIAISLVPPLSVVGISYSQGDWRSGNGALLLFATNMLAILVMGGVTFVFTGVTPLSRVAANQRRVRTWLAAIAVLGGLVLGALLLNGSEITSNLIETNTVEKTVDDWLGEHEGYEMVSTTVSGDTIDTLIVGPSQGRPSAAELADRLADALDRSVVVEVRLVVEEREVAESG